MSVERRDSDLTQPDPVGSMDRKARHQRGAALLNLALALGVGISISAGAFWVATPALERVKYEKSLRIMSEVVVAIHEGWANQATYATLTEDVLKSQGNLRPEYWNGSNLQMPVGYLDIRPTGIGGGCSSSGYCDNGFRLTLRNLDKTACRFFAVQNMGSRHRSTFASGGTGFTWINDRTPAEAAAACGNTDSSKLVGFEFE